MVGYLGDFVTFLFGFVDNIFDFIVFSGALLFFLQVKKNLNKETKM